MESVKTHTMNTVSGKNKFCVPSVMSAIAGISTDEAEAVIKLVTGQKKAVRAVLLIDMIKAFREIGYYCNEREPTAHTVFGCLFTLRKHDGFYIFYVKDHVIAIEVNGDHMYICDNHSKEPVNMSSSSRLGMQVFKIYTVGKLR